MSEARKILLVEDEKIIIDLLERKLKEQGYKVIIARNGIEGLVKMAKENPNLILLDIIMPQMGGFETMEKMQEDKELKKIPVIIISNSGQPVELDRARALGVKDWLIKTEFDPQEVLDKVRKQFGE